jgi:hypothetical protein
MVAGIGSKRGSFEQGLVALQLPFQNFALCYS